MDWISERGVDVSRGGEQNHGDGGSAVHGEEAKARGRTRGAAE